eukprot:gene10026-13482_t
MSEIGKESEDSDISVLLHSSPSSSVISSNFSSIKGALAGDVRRDANSLRRIEEQRDQMDKEALVDSPVGFLSAATDLLQKNSYVTDWIGKRVQINGGKHKNRTGVVLSKSLVQEDYYMVNIDQTPASAYSKYFVRSKYFDEVVSPVKSFEIKEIIRSTLPKNIPEKNISKYRSSPALSLSSKRKVRSPDHSRRSISYNNSQSTHSTQATDAIIQTTSKVPRSSEFKPTQPNNSDAVPINRGDHLIDKSMDENDFFYPLIGRYGCFRTDVNKFVRIMAISGPDSSKSMKVIHVSSGGTILKRSATDKRTKQSILKFDKLLVFEDIIALQNVANGESDLLKNAKIDQKMMMKIENYVLSPKNQIEKNSKLAKKQQIITPQVIPQGESMMEEEEDETSEEDSYMAESRNNLYWASCDDGDFPCLWYGYGNTSNCSLSMERKETDMIQVIPINWSEPLIKYPKMVIRSEIEPLDEVVIEKKCGNNSFSEFLIALLSFAEWDDRDRLSYEWPSFITAMFFDHNQLINCKRFVREFDKKRPSNKPIHRIYLLYLCANHMGLMEELISNMIKDNKCSSDIRDLLALVSKILKAPDDVNRTGSRVGNEFQSIIPDLQMPNFQHSDSGLVWRPETLAENKVDRYLGMISTIRKASISKNQILEAPFSTSRFEEEFNTYNATVSNYFQEIVELEEKEAQQFFKSEKYYNKRSYLEMRNLNSFYAYARSKLHNKRLSMFGIFKSSLQSNDKNNNDPVAERMNGPVKVTDHIIIMRSHREVTVPVHHCRMIDEYLSEDDCLEQLHLSDYIISQAIESIKSLYFPIASDNVTMSISRDTDGMALYHQAQLDLFYFSMCRYELELRELWIKMNKLMNSINLELFEEEVENGFEIPSSSFMIENSGIYCSDIMRFSLKEVLRLYYLLFPSLDEESITAVSPLTMGLFRKLTLKNDNQNSDIESLLADTNQPTKNKKSSNKASKPSLDSDLNKNKNINNNKIINHIAIPTNPGNANDSSGKNKSKSSGKVQNDNIKATANVNLVKQANHNTYLNANSNTDNYKVNNNSDKATKDRTLVKSKPKAEENNGNVNKITIPNCWPPSFPFVFHNLYWMKDSNVPCLCTGIDRWNRYNRHESFFLKVVLINCDSSHTEISVSYSKLDQLDERIMKKCTNERTVAFAWALIDFCKWELSKLSPASFLHKWYVYPTFIRNFLSHSPSWSEWRKQTERANRGKKSEWRSWYSDSLISTFIKNLLVDHLVEVNEETIFSKDYNVIENGPLDDNYLEERYWSTSYPWDDTVSSDEDERVVDMLVGNEDKSHQKSPNNANISDNLPSSQSPSSLSSTTSAVNDSIIYPNHDNERNEMDITAIQKYDNSNGKKRKSSAIGGNEFLSSKIKSSTMNNQVQRGRLSSSDCKSSNTSKSCYNLFWLSKHSLPCVFYDSYNKIHADKFIVLPICCVTYHYAVEVNVSSIEALTLDKLKGCSDERTLDFTMALIDFAAWCEDMLNSNCSKASNENEDDPATSSSPPSLRSPVNISITCEFMWPEFILSMLNQPKDWSSWRKKAERRLFGTKETRRQVYFSVLKEDYSSHFMDDVIDEIVSGSSDHVLSGSQQSEGNEGNETQVVTTSHKSQETNNDNNNGSISLERLSFLMSLPPLSLKPPSYYGLYWVCKSSLPCIYYDNNANRSNQEIRLLPICCTTFHYPFKVPLSSTETLIPD